MTDHDDNVFGNTRSAIYVRLFRDLQRIMACSVGDKPPVVGDRSLLSCSVSGLHGTLAGDNPAMNGLGYSYAVFAQDDWKVTPSLTFEFRLHTKIHPP